MDVATAGVTLGIGAAIAAVVAIVKMAFPALPGRAIPLIVLALSALLIGLGVMTGGITGDALNIVLQVIAQAAATLGIREGVVGAVPSAGNLSLSAPK